MLDLVIRPELPADFDAIHDVVRRAFNDEPTAELVRRIRDSDSYIPEFSLVACSESKLVGYVMLSYVELDDGRERHRVLSLSPLAVAPATQRRGIGGALIREVLERADVAGEPLVVLEGSPDYYTRFGFEPAERFGIRIDLPPWAPAEAAQVVRLARYTDFVRGQVIYPESFDVVNQDR